MRIGKIKRKTIPVGYLHGVDNFVTPFASLMDVGKTVITILVSGGQYIIIISK